MKAVLIHGEHEAQARMRFLEVIKKTKDRGYEIRHLNLRDSKLSFSEHLSADSLFSSKTLFAVSDTKQLSLKDLDWLEKSNEKLDVGLLLLHKGNAIAALKKALPTTTKIEKFDIPRLIFKFLDTFYPGNSKTSLKMLHELYKTEAVEFVFSMIARHFRDLYWSVSDFDTLTYPAWRKSRLKSQAGKFGQKRLKKIIDELAKIDIKSKTGKGALTTLLDLLIIRELQ